MSGTATSHRPPPEVELKDEELKRLCKAVLSAENAESREREGLVARLRRAVRRGTYKPDPAKIAGALLDVLAPRRRD